jgi:hypothetical protein
MEVVTKSTFEALINLVDKAAGRWTEYLRGSGVRCFRARNSYTVASVVHLVKAADQKSRNCV